MKGFNGQLVDDVMTMPHCLCRLPVWARRIRWLVLAAAIAGMALGHASGQGPLQFKLPGNVGGGLGGPLGVGGESDEASVEFSARVTGKANEHEAELQITAAIPPGWHIYSLTQAAGGPIRTRISLEYSPDYFLVGPFLAAPPPEIVPPGPKNGFKVNAEQHEMEVVWTAPLKLSDGATLDNLVIRGTAEFGLCNEKGCLPPKTVSFSAKKGAGGSQGFSPPGLHTTLSGTLSAAEVRAGDPLTVTLTAAPDAKAGYHVYGFEATPGKRSGFSPTQIVLLRPVGWQMGEVRSSAEPARHTIEGVGEVPWHEAPVSWTFSVTPPAGTKPGEYELRGHVGLQTCTEKECDPPSGATFSAKVKVVEQPAGQTGEVKLALAGAKYKPEAGLDAEQLHSTPLESGIGLILLIAVLGGFILNFMPCVLPVIGLKVLAFVEQSGGKRGEIFALNLAYSLGMLLVFWVLAVLAYVFHFGWGEQLQSHAFNFTMASVVFAMALSFLGVWEIPIPGFVGGGNVGKLARKEGYAGAIVKGVVTTLLATPCSGPGIATAFTWASQQQSAALVFLVFTCMGLGMASPYLLIGAYPALLRFLPKPGAWMETFKQLMGFVLLFTVVFIFSYQPADKVVPLFAFLMGLWLVCWWIGKIDPTAEFQVRLRGWLVAGILTVCAGWVSFGWLGKIMSDRFSGHSEYALAWQPYSLEKLTDLTEKKQTVMVDFTADWCLTCKTLEATVLNTQAVKQAVEANRIVPLTADWTSKDEKIKAMLAKLGSAQVPVLAIFPSGRPNEPIVLYGGYTQTTLLAKLEEAGPSQQEAAVAMAGREPPR